MQKWEYKFIRIRKVTDQGKGTVSWEWDDASLKGTVEDRLNEFGKLGWEVVGCSGGDGTISWTFKRPLDK